MIASGGIIADLISEGVSPALDHPIHRHCPICGADEGRRCLGRRGPRKTFHRARGNAHAGSAIARATHLVTESPIEQRLVAAILEWIDFHDSDAKLETQVPIGPYRADVVVRCAGRCMVVEADGRKYHSSAEQVEKDKRRDRYCVARGIAVMRFSGSEIEKDPRGCAAEVGAWIRFKWD